MLKYLTKLSHGLTHEYKREIEREVDIQWMNNIDQT